MVVETASRAGKPVGFVRAVRETVPGSLRKLYTDNLD